MTLPCLRLNGYLLPEPSLACSGRGRSEVLVHFVICVGSLALHCWYPQGRRAVPQSSLCFAPVSLSGDTLLVTAAIILESLGKSRQAEVISTMSNKIFL